MAQALARGLLRVSLSPLRGLGGHSLGLLCPSAPPGSRGPARTKGPRPLRRGDPAVQARRRKVHAGRPGFAGLTGRVAEAGRLRTGKPCTPGGAVRMQMPPGAAATGT